MARKRTVTRRPWESRPVRIASAGVLVSSGLLGTYVGGYRSPRAWASGSIECSDLVGDISTDDSLNAAIDQINLGNCNTLDISSDITLGGDLTPINISNLDDTVSSSLTIEGTSGTKTISGNSSHKGLSVTGATGAVYGFVIELKHIVLEDFSRTGSGFGGAALAVDVDDALPVLLRSVRFSGNSSDDSGGAVSLESQGQINLVIDDSALFQGNYTTGGTGGALYLNSGGGDVGVQVGFGQATYFGFANNSANTGDGGAIALTTGLSLEGSTFTGNTALSGRGGAIAANGLLSLTSSTFTTNDAREGGALFSTGTINSDTNYFANNRALAGRGGSVFGSSVVIDDDEHRSNTSDDSSGTAISAAGAVFATTTVQSQNSTFMSNSVTGGNGGALWADLVYSDGDSFTSNSTDDSGGAIWSDYSANIENSTFISNTAGDHGGALAVPAGGLDIDGGTFTSNSAVTGGAVYQSGLRFNLDNSLFTSNTAESGGAIHHRISRLDTKNSRFEANSATVSGGAIYSAVDNTSNPRHQLIISGSTFRGNTADDTGGGIYFNPRNTTELLSASGVWFDDNYAPESGAIHSRGRLQIRSTLFSGNDASVQAGAVGDDSGVLLIETATFINNGDDTAPFAGGGLVSSPFGYAYLGNVTAVGNSAKSRGGFAYFRGGTSVQPNEVTFSTVTGNSLVSGPSAGIDADNSAVTSVINSVVQGNLEGAGTYDLYLPAAGSSLTYSFVTSVDSVDPSSLESGTGVLFGSNPGLAVLTDNGGYSVGATGDDTYMPTRKPESGSPLIGAATAASGQADFDAVGATRSTTGSNAIGAVNVATPVPPTPTPIPASPPRDVSAIGGDRQVTVSWQAPASTGSFPVSSYQMQASPGGASCVAPAAELTCVITGLTNGVEYTVRGRALTGAGWSAFSAASAPVTPGVDQTIVISGSREGQRVVVQGVTTGLVGALVTPWFRFPGPGGYAPGSGVRTVDEQGEFTWQRRTGKKIYVYFRADDELRSNRVIIRP